SCAFSCTRPASAESYTLSLHDALPIWRGPAGRRGAPGAAPPRAGAGARAAPPAAVLRPAAAGPAPAGPMRPPTCGAGKGAPAPRSEEHTSELQSRENLVCRLLLEKKKR